MNTTLVSVGSRWAGLLTPAWDPGCATGFHLYYFERQQQWFINDHFDASKDEALAYADASDGKLPVGKMMWSMTDPDDKTEPTGEAELRLSLQKW